MTEGRAVILDSVSICHVSKVDGLAWVQFRKPHVSSWLTELAFTMGFPVAFLPTSLLLTLLSSKT